MIALAASKERGEKPDVILARLRDCFPSWAQEVQSLEQVEISRLNGLSNACYKVELKPEVQLPSDDSDECPRVVLYRKFECEIIDKRVESTVF